MNLVSATDFDIPPYTIPNLDKKANTFTVFVFEQQEEILLKVLGRNLYDSFIDGLDALPSAWSSTVATVIDQQYIHGNNIWKALTVQTGTAPVEGADWELVEEDNRWLLLKNGNTYAYNDKVYYFKGMSKIMRPFIYSKWLEYTFDQHVGVGGLTIPKTENSQTISPATRIITSWNDFARNIGDKCNQIDTLYGYLINTNTLDGSFDDTFDDSFDTFQDYLNYCFNNPGLKNHLDL